MGDTEATTRDSSASLIDAIRWDAQGLVPAIVQHDLTGQVLMMAYMNRLSLEKTLETGETHFWSRSRQELWHKGGTSGNTQRVTAIHIDCDGDTLVVLVDPAGPACHTNEYSCFYRRLDGDTDPEAKPFRYRLYDLLQDRKQNPKPGSYTTQLLKAGEARILQKVGEEAVEVIVAAQAESEERLLEEAADLMYHLTLLMVRRDIPCDAVDRVLRSRYAGR